MEVENVPFDQKNTILKKPAPFILDDVVTSCYFHCGVLWLPGLTMSGTPQ